VTLGLKNRPVPVPVSALLVLELLPGGEATVLEKLQLALDANVGKSPLHDCRRFEKHR
jgi:hypothetical protein